MKRLDERIAEQEQQIWRQARAVAKRRIAMSRAHAAAAALLTLALASLSAAQAPPRKEPNRGGALDLASQDPKVALERIKVADGYEVSLFASEREFPDLAKPLAMTFDTRGRLWVLTSPTYPHVAPDEKPNDKLIVLEDTNGDGKADKSTVFADRLYIPTGFALGDGGVYISQQPKLMFMQDTNGDGKADERRDPARLRHRGQPPLDPRLQWGPDGALYFQEGTFLHSQVETPYGPRASPTPACGATSRAPRSWTSSCPIPSPTRGDTSSTPGGRTSSATRPTATTTGARRSPATSTTPTSRSRCRSGR